MTSQLQELKSLLLAIMGIYIDTIIQIDFIARLNSNPKFHIVYNEDVPEQQIQAGKTANREKLEFITNTCHSADIRILGIEYEEHFHSRLLVS